VLYIEAIFKAPWTLNVLIPGKIPEQMIYYVVEHNYLLFRNSYMFRSFKTIIGPTTL